MKHLHRRGFDWPDGRRREQHSGYSFGAEWHSEYTGGDFGTHIKLGEGEPNSRERVQDEDVAR